MAQADLGKVRMTDEELSEKIIQTNGGVRLGKDADGKPGYVVTDAETGADTVIPFSNASAEMGKFEVMGCVNAASTSTYVSISVNNIAQKEYKNLLILYSYTRPNKLKNFPDVLSITKGAANTYEMEEIYTQDNFSDNVFCYYKMLFCNKCEKNKTINLTFSLSLKQTDSASKNVTVCIIGIY